MSFLGAMMGGADMARRWGSDGTRVTSGVERLQSAWDARLRAGAYCLVDRRWAAL